MPDPFRDRFTWWVPEPLDLRALWLAADPFVGEHDFASFCRKGPEGSTTMRTVFESSWVDEGDGVLRYEIRAGAFCWQMVRAIVGTLVEVGVGKRRPGEMLGIIAAQRSRRRRAARAAARPVPLGGRLLTSARRRWAARRRRSSCRRAARSRRPSARSTFDRDRSSAGSLVGRELEQVARLVVDAARALLVEEIE